MAWDLSEAEQDRLMKAVGAAIKPWMGRKATSILWINGDGTEERRPLTIEAVRDEAPEEIKALEAVYADVIVKGAVIGGGSSFTAPVE